MKEATQDLKEINLAEFSKEATDAVENINQNGECDKEELIRVSNELFAGVNQVFRYIIQNTTAFNFYPERFFKQEVHMNTLILETLSQIATEYVDF